MISVTIYSFALTARYENTIGATLKNALLLTVAKLPYTILMTALTVGAVVLSWWNTGILMLTIPVWILAGTGILAFINSCILRRVFRVFDEKAEGGDEEERTDILDDIAGIGAKRRKQLMKRFVSLDAIKAASVEQLAEVESMNEQAAQNVYEFFHKKDS